jgi:hypothetical protein
MAEIIYGAQKEQEWLEKQSYKALEKWLATYLSDGISAPIFIGAMDVPRNTIIYQYHNSSTKRDFKERLEKAIENLINEWRLDEGSPQQLIELVALAGRLRITGAFDRILALIKEEKLKQVFEPGIDLHCHLLRTLIGFQIGFDTQMLIDRDIDDFRYAPVVFRAVWSRSRDGFIEALSLLRSLWKTYSANPSMDIHGLLREFFIRIKFENFEMLLNSMIWNLGSGYFKQFILMLSEIGIMVKPHSDSSFIVKWNLNGGSQTGVIPSPFVRLFVGDFETGQLTLLDDWKSNFANRFVQKVFKDLQYILLIPEYNDPETEEFKDIAIEIQQYFDSKQSEQHVQMEKELLQELRSI